MWNLIFKRFLIYVMCLLGINSFLICTRVSFAYEKENNRIFSQRSSDYDESHNAGRNCLTSGCHSGVGEKRFYIGGTIYTDADGTNARVGAKIKVIDTNGSTVTLTSNQIGNFYTEKSMKAPFTITTSYQGREVKMPGEASEGGCNADGCHAEGSSVGRIFISTNDLDLSGTVTESSSDGGASEISYNSDIKSILDAKCISCHQSGGAKSDVPLTTYAEVTDTKLE